MVRTAIAIASAAAALALLAASPAAAKPIGNTQFALQTSQGQAGTLFYFRKHETEGRRFLFARIPVTLTCGGGERIEQSFVISGNLDKGDDDERLRLTETALGGDVSTKVMNVRLHPKPKRAKKGRRAAWKRARGTLTSDVTQNLIGGEVRYCSSGPVQFDTAIVTRF